MKALLFSLALFASPLSAQVIKGLPREQSTPVMLPYIALGLGVDLGLQLAKRPVWQRAIAIPAMAFFIRYSKCCKRPEGGHFGIIWGAGLGEVLGLAKKIL